MNKDQYEEFVMSLIVQAGQTRSMLMTAIREAKNGNFDEADSLVKNASLSLKEAHQIQTKLIEYDEGEGKLPVHIVMVHAQDHLMNAVLMMDLATEIIDLRKTVSQ
ncbi:PTS system, cellobiose-specific IIA component [Photobacterium sp. SKA34]|uniref:PTS lactose/cellobiose transporter subunit IIA n=1 Tax=Photobacterium sp. SKA34 TaxID=121723 RepID=UPI00006B417A|nr:PTS lactose/cellobiose transporter subunit IIA [Photobacterium sp. SKA34]EAR57542.1 PTS system, cellobiose-specific IIA component [Photobacterium sp. SKA34]